MNAQVLIAQEGEHSPLGPSSSNRWLACPGSVKASQGVANKDTEYSAYGTAGHLLSEHARKENKPVAHWLGWTIKVGSYEFVVDEEMSDAVQEFVDVCDEVPGIMIAEARVQYERWVPGGFGTNDDTRLNDGVVTITDLKLGKGHQVWAKENPQLKLYALGVLEDHGFLFDIREFNLRISQPRLGHFDEWSVSADELLAWADRELPAAVRRIEEGALFAAGEWCTFCPVRSTCKTRAAHVTGLMLAEGEFEDLDNLETNALRAQNRWQHLTNDDVAKILPSLGVMEAWIKDMKHRALVALVNKEKVGDYKIVAGRSSRKWRDEYQARVKLHSLGVEPFKPQQIISVSVAEKELGKKTFAQRFKLEEDFVKPPGKPTLAPGSDKRPAIEVTEVNDFQNLDDE